MKYVQSDLLKKSLVLLAVISLTLACSTSFAQDDEADAASEAAAADEVAFTDAIKEATGLPFPFFIAVVFLPPGIGLFVLCMGADRRERDKEEEYRPARLAETLEGGQQMAPQGGPARIGGAQPCKEAKQALTYGIIAVVLIPVMGIPAILTGLKAKKLIAADRRLTGEGNALAGIILGFAALAIWALAVLVIMMQVM